MVRHGTLWHGMVQHGMGRYGTARGIARHAVGPVTDMAEWCGMVQPRVVRHAVGRAVEPATGRYGTH